MKNNEQDKDNDDEGNDFFESVGIKCISYSDMTDRYFTKYYLDKGTDKEQFVFIHSNGILLCGFGKNHMITKQKINTVSDLKKPGKITGRKKHGAHFIMENERIISINYGDNQLLNFAAKIRGKLLEVNQNIIENTKLINDYPEKYGFVCIVSMEPNHLEELRKNLETLN